MLAIYSPSNKCTTIGVHVHQGLFQEDSSSHQDREAETATRICNALLL